MILMLLGTAFIVYLIHQFYWRRRNLPPGPTPLPLMGNLLSLYFYEPGYDAYTKYGKEYGGVFTFWLGTEPAIMITDYQIMKKQIQMDGEKYSDRWHFMNIQEFYRGGKYGIIETDGSYWREQRRFTLHVLRDFGMGKNLMEQRVLEEITALCARINKNDGVMLVHDTLDMAVGSIINNLLFGYRFDENNKDLFYNIKGTMKKQATEFTSPIFLLMFMFPLMRHLPYFNGKFAKLLAYRDIFFEFFRKQIKDHEKEIDLESEESQDYVEAYLKEQHRRTDEENFGGYSHKQLENIVFDLWLAGLETTSNTLTWGLIYLVNNPEVISKLQQELDTVVGRDRMVTLADKNNLPYSVATVSEIQRLANIVPLNLFRITGEDVEIEGHKIAKDTAILPQISAVLYDERIFPDPYHFNPDRFVDENGKFKNIPEFVPFSMGKRQCIGEGLARLELFLFITNLLHRYDLSCENIPTMKKTFITTAQAENFTCKFVDRLASN